MEQFLNQVLRASWPIKIGVISGLALLLTAGTWYFSVEPTRQQIERAEEERKRLEEDYIDKQQIADNLNEYRKQKAELEEKLQETLAELPHEKAIDELLRQLDEVGVASGLQILSVHPQAEQVAEFFARIPIKMRVSGNFHDVASFFDEVGKLKRIVNVSDIQFSRPTTQADKVILTAEFTATTFRYLDPSEIKKKKSAKGRGRRR